MAATSIACGAQSVSTRPRPVACSTAAPRRAVLRIEMVAVPSPSRRTSVSTMAGAFSGTTSGAVNAMSHSSSAALERSASTQGGARHLDEAGPRQDGLCPAHAMFVEHPLADRDVERCAEERGRRRSRHGVAEAGARPSPLPRAGTARAPPPPCRPLATRPIAPRGPASRPPPAVAHRRSETRSRRRSRSGRRDRAPHSSTRTTRESPASWRRAPRPAP